ncbi:hypothetical protein BDV10DRAFT_170926 [Aspergillus recurvatus]
MVGAYMLSAAAICILAFVKVLVVGYWSGSVCNVICIAEHRFYNYGPGDNLPTTCVEIANTRP